MDRAELLERLQIEFHATAVELDAAESDTNAGYRYVLDAAFRLLGADPLTTTALTTQADLAFTAVAYFALRKFQRLAIPQVNVSLGGGLALAKSRQQTWEHITKMLEEARKELRGAGYDVDIVDQDASGNFVWGTYDLGFLGEPERGRGHEWE